jgi:hypothetical protein
MARGAVNHLQEADRTSGGSPLKLPATRPTSSAAPGSPLALSRVTDRSLQFVRTQLPALRWHIERLGAAGLGGLAALLATVGVAVFLLRPEHQSVVALNAQLARGGPMIPAHSIDSPQTLAAALPTRAQIPAVLGQVLIAAHQAGVSLETGTYAYQPPHADRLGRYSLEFPVKAPYPNIRDFIDRTLRAVPAAGLEKLRIKRSDVGATTTNADIGFVVYLRGD